MVYGHTFALFRKCLFAEIVLLAGFLFPGQAQAVNNSFKDHILPIFERYCTECHQPGAEGFETSGLDLTTYEGVMKGTKYGAIVIPGDSFSSNLNVLIEGRADIRLKMPHSRKGLSRWERVMIRRWVNRGAKNN